MKLLPRNVLGTDFAEAASITPYHGRNAVESNTIVVKRRSRGWFVYVDGRLSARFPDRFAGPVDVALEATPVVADAEEPYVQRIAPFRFTDDFLIDAADEQGKALRHWDARSGDWSVYSVADAVASSLSNRRRGRNARRRQRLPEAERSPNFYCLQGCGSNAVFLAGHAFHDRYSLSAALHAGEGENGIVFLATPDGGFHAFTATPGPRNDGLRLSLWHTATGNIEDRRILARWDTDLLPGQWHRLAVAVHDDRIAPAVNGVELPPLETPLPPGGRYGLFAHGPEATRFDDVAAFSHEDEAFPDVRTFRSKLLTLEGSLQGAKGALPLAPRADCGETQPEEHLVLSASDRAPALALFGATADAPHVQSTAVRGNGRPFEVALIAGWQGKDAPAVRFVFRQTGTERIFLLERAQGGLQPTGELARLAIPAPPSKAPVELMLDATDPDGLLRAYADGRLVVVCSEPLDLRGAAGLSVPAKGRAELALPWYRSTRQVYRNKFEKTNAFAIDPYMRHWASPEGEWITTRNNGTWLKGDRFGALSIRMPWVAPSRLHLAVPEDRTDGPLQVAAADNRLELRIAAPGTTNLETVASVPIEDLEWRFTDEKGTQSNRWYSVQLEDHVVWLRSGARALFAQSLPVRHTGRRTRLEGLDVPQLAQTLVERTVVMDFLFTESLHEWTLNGGDWEVVNRFQCDPRWSHLNGQNGENLAALWSHYEFEGDFCAEFYAGMRHGWYDRAGDLNLTVLGAADAPASGYTFVCTGWDPDESQSQSRLFRNGELLAATDQYLVPRIREGNVRRGYNPLIAGGRDMHGAWYYTQLRRADGELQVSFDHEPVLSVRDPKPLTRGGFGIWTYRNSMVVARVKMAAERIRRKRFALTPVPDHSAPEQAWPPDCRPVVAAVARAAQQEPAEMARAELNPDSPAWPKSLARPATTNGIPLFFWTPETWAAQDPVSNARLDWKPTAAAPDTFVMTARQAGGTFLASNAVPAAPLRDLAGWRFEIARTPDAQVNFHYMVGRREGAVFKPAQGFFHRLSGSDETRGALLQSGMTDVPPSTADPTRLLDGPWTTVEVWLPAFPKEEETLWVRVEGFGNLQPSDVQQGLLGNRPGASYAVRNFAPILMGAPSLDPATFATDTAAALESAIHKRVGIALQEMPLPEEAFPLSQRLYWVMPPDNLNLVAAWSRLRHDAVDIHSEILWPVRKLKGIPASVENREAVVIPREGNRLQVLIPRDLAAPTSGLYQVSLATSSRRPVTWGLPATARPGCAPPILVALESPEFQMRHFEEDTSVPPESANGVVRLTDPEQGHFLQTANRGKLQRLATPLLENVDLARNPVLRFRYRGEGYAGVSLRLQGVADIAFTETPPYGAGKVRSTPAQIDSAWRTWSGFLTDAVPEQPYRGGTFLRTPRISLQSCHPRDQTGLYAQLAVDDIVAGPAIGPSRPLVVTPRILDLDGDGHIEWCVLPRTDPAAPETEPAAEEHGGWSRCASGEPLTVPLDERPDGLYDLCLRAASPRAAGPVLRVPFLVDRKPIVLSHRLISQPGAGNGALLELNLNLDGGSPPQFQNLSVRCGEEPVVLNGANTRIALNAGSGHFRLDWPLLLRKQVQNSADGDTLALQFERLLDGAGNATGSYTAQIPIRYADDHHPPTLLATTLSTNIFWISSWSQADHPASFSSLQQCGTQMLPATTNNPPILQVHVHGSTATAGQLFQKPAWDPAAHPWLALRAGFAKLPAKTTPATLQLVLLHQSGKENPKPVAIDLFLPRDRLPEGVSGKADWSAGGISELLIDVPKVLELALKSKSAVGSITALQFVFNAAQGAVFQIHQVMLASPWRTEDALEFDAYDASGIAGLVWQGDGGSAETSLHPASLALPGEDAAWIRLQLRDRAGNQSPLLPFPRLAQPVSAAPQDSAP